MLILDEPTMPPAGRRRADEGARAAEGAGPGGDLHHAQALRPFARRLSRSSARAARGDDRPADLAKDHEELRAEIVRSCSKRRRGWPTSRRLRDALSGSRATSQIGVTGDVALELRTEHPGEGASWASRTSRSSSGEGEILGVAGVDGNGQRPLAEVIAASAVPRTARSRCSAAGSPACRCPPDSACATSPTTARRGALSVAGRDQSVPEADRRAAVLEHGRIQRAAIDQRAGGSCGTRSPSVGTRAGTLGRERPEVLPARELSFDPRVVVSASRPGLDVKTTATVRDLIRRLDARGVAALVISTDSTSCSTSPTESPCCRVAGSSAWSRTAPVSLKRSVG